MTKKRLIIIRAFTALMAAAFVIYGVYKGEADAVLRKAINVCLECIGIG